MDTIYLRFVSFAEK